MLETHYASHNVTSLPPWPTSRGSAALERARGCNYCNRHYLAVFGPRPSSCGQESPLSSQEPPGTAALQGPEGAAGGEGGGEAAQPPGQVRHPGGRSPRRCLESRFTLNTSPGDGRLGDPPGAF